MGKSWKAPKPAKIRKPRITWQINPVERIHSDSEYRRNHKEEIEKALDEMESESEEISKELSLYDEMMLGCDDYDDDYKYEEFQRLTGHQPQYTDKELKVMRACKDVIGTYQNMTDFIKAYANLPNLEIIVETKNPHINNWIPNSWNGVPIKFKHVGS